MLSVHPHEVVLDRNWQGSRHLPFEFLIVATGTRLSQPAAIHRDTKESGVCYLKSHQAQVEQARSILLVGGGAVGVQLATDIKERYPDKEVVLVQSRAHTMPQFVPDLHELVQNRFKELGISLITSARVRIPPGGFPNDGQPFEVQITNGQTLSTEFVILATGQKPNNSLLEELNSSVPGCVLNPDNGYIKVGSALQLKDERYPNIFAVGDIADTGSHKAARPGLAQMKVAVQNIQNMIEGKAPEAKYEPGPAGIHLTLGMVRKFALLKILKSYQSAEAQCHFSKP